MRNSVLSENVRNSVLSVLIFLDLWFKTAPLMAYGVQLPNLNYHLVNYFSLWTDKLHVAYLTSLFFSLSDYG